MNVEFKLFASLTDYLPQQGRDGNVLRLEVPEGTTILQMIDRFALPQALVHLVLVNGVYIEPALRAERRLKEGDALAIWPPIAGG